MADNVPITPGAGENVANVATDDVGGVQFQKIKVDLGGDGLSSPLVRGQQTAANSLPVVLASDQDALPVSLASGPLPPDAATETTLGTRLSESVFDTKVGALDETPPADDTASSGLNGRLQRIAQRITSLIGLLPAALTSGGNLKVAVVEATNVAAAGTLTNRSLTSLAGSSETLMSSNSSRKKMIVQNTGNADIGIRLDGGGAAAIGGTGTLTLYPGGSYESTEFVPTSAVTVIGTAGQTVAAYEA